MEGTVMGLLKKEIIELAQRYLPEEEITDFPYDGDLFCILIRTIPVDRVLAEEEGWAFNGYGVCTQYRYDEEAKPRGKWLWMHFASLTTFPPVAQVLKLQPPHVVKGRFQSVDRSHEIRLVKVAISSEKAKTRGKKTPVSLKKSKSSTKKKADNIVAFRTKGTS
jgi:hypothetical protein